MKSTISAAWAVMALVSTASQAATISAGSAACASEALFVQLAAAITTKDERAIDWLSKRGCIITREDFPATLLSTGESGAHEVRVYGDNGLTVNMWTTPDRVVE